MLSTLSLRQIPGYTLGGTTLAKSKSTLLPLAIAPSQNRSGKVAKSRQQKVYGEYREHSQTLVLRLNAHSLHQDFYRPHVIPA